MQFCTPLQQIHLRPLSISSASATVSFVEVVIATFMSRSLLGLLGLSTVATVASMNLVVKGAGSAVVNGLYLARPPAQIPVGFAR